MGCCSLRHDFARLALGQKGNHADGPLGKQGCRKCASPLPEVRVQALAQLDRQLAEAGGTAPPTLGLAAQGCGEGAGPSLGAAEILARPLVVQARKTTGLAGGVGQSLDTFDHVRGYVPPSFACRTPLSRRWGGRKWAAKPHGAPRTTNARGRPASSVSRCRSLVGVGRK